MVASYEINQAEEWEEIFSNTFKATFIQGKATKVYHPIPPTELPVNIDTPLIAVYCTSPQYPNSHPYLGSIAQYVNLPGSLPTTAAISKSKGIYCNRTTLIDFTQFSGSYNLLLSPKYYVEEFTVTVYKFVGAANSALNNQLNSIEQKVDQTLAKINLSIVGQNITPGQQLITSIYFGVL